MNCNIEKGGQDFWQNVTNGPRKLSDYLLQVTHKYTSVTFGLDFNQLNHDLKTLLSPYNILSTLSQVEFTNTGCDRSVLNLLQCDGEAYCHSAWQAGRALPRLATSRDRSGAPRLPP